MLGNFTEKIQVHWDCIIERYLMTVDTACENGITRIEAAKSRIHCYSLKTEGSSKLVKLTLSGIIITFTVLLFSCQSLPLQQTGGARPLPQSFDSRGSEKSPDQLFLRRNDLQITSREIGSNTGSIWADAQDPRTLLTDSAPSREGQTITILIPDELQFNPQSVVSSDGKKPAKDEDKKKESTEQSGIKLTDPDEASPSFQVMNKPMTSFKMQIVGFEAGGDVYLRGSRRFVNASGEETTAMVVAKVPRRHLNGYSLDARELTEVAVNESQSGHLKEYSSPGWDEMVSRRLAGFSPDLKSEMGALDGLRDEIKVAQKSLREQSKANELERERLRKDRERLEGQASRAQAGANQTPSSQPAAEQTTAQSEGGK